MTAKEEGHIIIMDQDVRDFNMIASHVVLCAEDVAADSFNTKKLVSWVYQ